VSGQALTAGKRRLDAAPAGWPGFESARSGAKMVVPPAGMGQ